MTDRVVQYPNRFRLTLVSGTTDTYDLTAVPGVITAAGSDISKANLLSDTTAAAIASAMGITLPSDPTVNDALSALTGRCTKGSYTPNNTARTIALGILAKLVIIIGTQYVSSSNKNNGLWFVGSDETIGAISYYSSSFQVGRRTDTYISGTNLILPAATSSPNGYSGTAGTMRWFAFA